MLRKEATWYSMQGVSEIKAFQSIVGVSTEDWASPKKEGHMEAEPVTLSTKQFGFFLQLLQYHKNMFRFSKYKISNSSL